MDKTKIKAVEMTRRIRDAHLEQLRGKTPEEWAVFYREKASALQASITSDASNAQPEQPRTVK
jgi:hypothetical protein